MIIKCNIIYILIICIFYLNFVGCINKVINHSKMACYKSFVNLK